MPPGNRRHKDYQRAEAVSLNPAEFHEQQCGGCAYYKQYPGMSSACKDCKRQPVPPDGQHYDPVMDADMQIQDGDIISLIPAGGFGDMIDMLQSNIKAAEAADPDSNVFHTHAANITQRQRVHRIELTNEPCRLFQPLKLCLELVPATAWFSNIRGICEPATWDIIRKRTYQAYQYRCGICGGVGRSHPVECHEVWVYDDIGHIMALGSLIALCPACHSVKHMGFTQTKGGKALRDAISHMAAVNQISIEQCISYIKYYDNIMVARSLHEWLLDKPSLTLAAPELMRDAKFLSLI